MPAIKAVFLDVGMTLITPKVAEAETFFRFSREFGIETTQEALARGLALGEGHFAATLRDDRQVFSAPEKILQLWTGIYRAALREAGVVAPQSVQMACVEAVTEFYETVDAWCAFPDVEPALQALRASGYRMGAVSDWGHGLTDILHALGLSRYLDFAVGSATVRAAKPAGHIFELALRRAAVQPQEAVHVGDSYLSDIVGARAAGLTPILLDRRQKRPPADCRVIHLLAELPELLTGL